jgi:hypothetical protein
MPQIGVPELLIVLVGVVFWIVPVVAGIWALITLAQIRRRQDDVLRKLDALERTIQGAPRG